MPTRLEAVLWDMDGVIVDTAEYHYQSWKESFEKRGVSFTREQFEKQFGRRNDSIIRDAFGRQLSAKEVDAIADEKEARYRELVRGNIRPLPGAVELIKSLYERGVRMAITSSAPAENIDLIIEGAGVKGYFQAIVSGREVRTGKPDPAVYLLGAKKLKVEPANCVVFEDAVAGVEGAKRAGMKCVAVTNTHPASRLQEADLVVDSLEKVTVERVAGLFGE